MKTFIICILIYIIPGKAADINISCGGNSNSVNRSRNPLLKPERSQDIALFIIAIQYNCYNNHVFILMRMETLWYSACGILIDICYKLLQLILQR